MTGSTYLFFAFPESLRAREEQRERVLVKVLVKALGSGLLFGLPFEGLRRDKKEEGERKIIIGLCDGSCTHEPNDVILPSDTINNFNLLAPPP